MKKRFMGILIALLIIVAVLPMKAAAADGADSISLTYNPKENIKFVLGDNKLTVTNLPDTTKFGTLMISILNSEGNSAIKQSVKRDGNGNATLPLSRLSNGYYYVELFFSVGNNLYNSYIYGNDLRFSWNNGSGTFVSPPNLENNKKVYENGRSDNAALAYYLEQTDTVQSSSEEIIKLANEITKGITDDYSKAYAIHGWVCENIWYDWDSAAIGLHMNTDALIALARKRTVCTGYSNLMAALLRASGIPAKVVGGTSKTSAWANSQLSGDVKNHFWNEAYVGGRWIIIDATWDSGNDYRGGTYEASDGLYYSRFFDVTLEAFSLDHYIGAYNDNLIPAPVEPPPIIVAQDDSTDENVPDNSIPMEEEPPPSADKEDVSANANAPVKNDDSADVNVSVTQVPKVDYTQYLARARDSFLLPKGWFTPSNQSAVTAQRLFVFS